MLQRLTILLLLFLTLPACNVRHRRIEQSGNWGPNTFLEDGALVTLYTAQCSDYHGPTLWYDPDREIDSNILTEEQAKWNKWGFDNSTANRLFYTAPPWRREEVLQEVTQRLAFDIPRPFQRILISSHNPVIIGLAPTSETYLHGPNIKFSFGPRHDTNPITKLLILRNWPNRDPHLSPLEDREILDLNPPQTGA